jgi:hypothetical protein
VVDRSCIGCPPYETLETPPALAVPTATRRRRPDADVVVCVQVIGPLPADSVTASRTGALTAVLTPRTRTPMSAQSVALLQDIVTDGACPGSADDCTLPCNDAVPPSGICPLPAVRLSGETKSTTRSLGVVSYTVTLGEPPEAVATVATGIAVATFENVSAIAAAFVVPMDRPTVTVFAPEAGFNR